MSRSHGPLPVLFYEISMCVQNGSGLSPRLGVIPVLAEMFLRCLDGSV
jgi:hypothetical protein